MAGRIDEIQLVGLPIFGVVVQRDTLGFNCNATLALDIHRVKHLGVHFPGTEATTMLNETVCKRGFAVVDMGDNGKISDIAKIAH